MLRCKTQSNSEEVNSSNEPILSFDTSNSEIDFLNNENKRDLRLYSTNLDEDGLGIHNNDLDNETSNEPVSASEAYEKFIRELIVYFREQPVIWDKNHPQNKDKNARALAMDDILTKCSHYPDANMDYVKTKLDTIRCTFRREYMKVQQSKKTAKCPDDIFKPTLWYYNDMLFSVEADPEKYKDELVEVVREKPNFIWNREDTLHLIEIVKDYPILYAELSWSKNLKVKKMAAINKVAERLSEKTGKIYDLPEVRQKIARLKNQRWKESRRLNKSGTPPTLWCYDLLEFLDARKSKRNKKKIEKSKRMKKECITDDETSDQYDSEDSGPKTTKRKSKRPGKQAKMKKEGKNPLTNTDEFSEDIFDIIGKHVVLKLREMSDDQKKYAENLVNEILYHGMMENLRWDTKITLRHLCNLGEH